MGSQHLHQTRSLTLHQKPQVTPSRKQSLHPIEELQAAIGNRATARLIKA